MQAGFEDPAQQLQDPLWPLRFSVDEIVLASLSLPFPYIFLALALPKNA